MDLLLRSVSAKDLPVFFEQQLDAEANAMAAFTVKDPSDRSSFDARWARILGNPQVRARTIVLGDQVVGHVMTYEEAGRPEVTYWLGRAFWGRGLATRALEEFLGKVQPQRPMYARTAKDNLASGRVLEKCGFRHVREDKRFANARGLEIEEWVWELR